MNRRSPSENAHRTELSRPSDMSARREAAGETTEPTKANPVGDFLASCDATPDKPLASPYPFGDDAVRLHELGLVVFPCGKDDGKRPLVKRWERPKAAKTIAVWAQRFAAANIGVDCGLSGCVVVDIDKAELVEKMLERFGDTPLMTRTPSGGVHLWYRKLGRVRSGNLRRQKS